MSRQMTGKRIYVFLRALHKGTAIETPVTIPNTAIPTAGTVEMSGSDALYVVID